MTRTIRRLDRSRSYGHILPQMGRKAFTQDHLHFDTGGYCVEDGPPPTPQELAGEKREAPQKGASLVSKPDDPAPDIGTGTLELTPRSTMEWQTMKFPVLKQLLLEKKQYKAPNQVAALRYLDSQNLIIKE